MQINGQVLRTLRKNAGLSQGALAANLSLSTSTVSNWERTNEITKIQMVHVIARYFNVSVFSITGIDEKELPLTPEQMENRKKEDKLLENLMKSFEEYVQEKYSISEQKVGEDGDRKLAKYIIELTMNESEGLHESGQTENFQVPSNLEKFEVYEEKFELAIKIATKKLKNIANDSIELYSIDEETKRATLTFSNCEDGLGLTYEIRFAV